MAKKAKTAVESPFDPDYYQKEIGRFNPVPYEKNGIVVKMVPEMFGRVDYQADFLPNCAFASSHKEAMEMASSLRKLKHIKFVNDPVRIR